MLRTMLVLRFVVPLQAVSTRIMMDAIKTSDVDGAKSFLRIGDHAIRIVLWLVALTAIAASFGFDTTQAVAGLGIGSLALAFGLK
jgi:small-conductance mechanosensitive channel